MTKIIEKGLKSLVGFSDIRAVKKAYGLKKGIIVAEAILIFTILGAGFSAYKVINPTDYELKKVNTELKLESELSYYVKDVEINVLDTYFTSKSHPECKFNYGINVRYGQKCYSKYIEDLEKEKEAIEKVIKKYDEDILDVQDYLLEKRIKSRK